MRNFGHVLGEFTHSRWAALKAVRGRVLPAGCRADRRGLQGAAMCQTLPLPRLSPPSVASGSNVLSCAPAGHTGPHVLARVGQRFWDGCVPSGWASPPTVLTVAAGPASPGVLPQPCHVPAPALSRASPWGRTVAREPLESPAPEEDALVSQGARPGPQGWRHPRTPACRPFQVPRQHGGLGPRLRALL